jgi:hypothetical protein
LEGQNAKAFDDIFAQSSSIDCIAVDLEAKETACAPLLKNVNVKPDSLAGQGVHFRLQEPQWMQAQISGEESKSPAAVHYDMRNILRDMGQAGVLDIHHQDATYRLLGLADQEVPLPSQQDESMPSRMQSQFFGAWLRGYCQQRHILSALAVQGAFGFIAKFNKNLIPSNTALEFSCVCERLSELWNEFENVLQTQPGTLERSNAETLDRSNHSHE